MDPITIALGLASIAPTIVKWITGSDQDAAVAQKVVDTAKAVTGNADPSGAVAAIKADPQLALQFQQAWQAHELSMYQAETERLKTVNDTIKAEVVSNDAYTRRMRPTFGYVLAASWGSLMMAITYRIILDPTGLDLMIDAVAKLAPMWEVALAVLGVYVYKRSSDKHAALGAKPQAILPWLRRGK